MIKITNEVDNPEEQEKTISYPFFIYLLKFSIIVLFQKK